MDLGLDPLDRLTDQLLNRLDEPFSPGLTNLPAFEADVSRVGIQLRLAESLDAPLPCLVGADEPPWPCDVLGLIGASADQPPVEDPSSSWLPARVQGDANMASQLQAAGRSRFMVVFDLLGQTAQASGMQIEGFGIDSLREAFRTRLRDDLQAVTKPPPANQQAGSASGINFEVHTTTNRLRIHYAPYRLNRSHWVFGQSTPARRLLGSGRWKFGVAAPLGLAVKWDGDSWVVPPDTSATLAWA